MTLYARTLPRRDRMCTAPGGRGGMPTRGGSSDRSPLNTRLTRTVPFPPLFQDVAMPEAKVLVEPGVGEGGDSSCLRVAAQPLLGRIRYPHRCSYMQSDVVVFISCLIFIFNKQEKDRTDGDGHEGPSHSF